MLASFSARELSSTACERVSRSDGATIRQVDLFGDGRLIGLFGLDLAFQQLYVMGKAPSEAVARELLAMIKANNYVPPRMTQEYAAGLLRLYTRFWEKQQQAASRQRQGR